MPDQTVEEYKQIVKEKLDKLATIFASASVGDFSQDIVIPEKEDEFTKLFVGLQVMLEVIREQLAELQEVDRKKTEFLSMTAHQLRTPLGGMRWYLETLMNKDRYELPQNVLEKLQHVHESNMRMIFLVNDLLDVSRIEQNKLFDEPRQVEILQIIEQLKIDLQYEIKNRSLTFTINAQNIPKVLVDPQQFREVLYQLFSNAIKYNTKGGSVVVTVTQNSTLLQIEIKDTGIGIPVKEQSRIFEKFFRASNAVVHDTGSTGLGLYIARSYVQRWKGTIEFKSSLQEGSTFCVTMPL